MIDETKLKNFLLKKYYRDLFKKRGLKSATFEILNSCNFKCVHCYNQNLKPCIMNKELAFRIIDELVDMGCKSVTLTGGETTLHPDFVAIYKYCHDKGLKIKLFTNGYFLNKYFDILRAFPPDQIEISIYGVSDDTYLRVCQIKNGFTIVDKNIRECKRLGLNLRLKSVIMQQNYEDFDEMLAYCQSLELPFRFDINVLNSKDFSNNQEKNKLLPDEYELIMNKVRKIRTGNWISYLTRENMQSDGEYLYSCGAGRISLFVNCLGGVRMCNFAEFTEENISDKSIKDIWQGFEKYLNLPKDKESECHTCKYKKFCSNCPVVTYMEHRTDGTKILPVAQNCREAKFIYESVKNDKQTRD